MGYWSIVVPETTVNRCLNPSAEVTSNFQPRDKAVITRSSAFQWVGVYSYRVVTSGTDEGLHLTLSALANAVHYVSMRARGTFNGTWQWSLDGANWTAPTNLSTSDGWTYYGASFVAAQANGSTSLRIRQSGAGVSDYYVDAVQVEEKSYVTTYCDGTQPGCYWNTGSGPGYQDITDAFTRANSAALGSTDTGQTWTETTYSISANTAINTPAVGANLVVNPGFENPGGGGADIWANWDENLSDGALANETVIVHAGADSAKLTSGPLANTYVMCDNFAVTGGTVYKLSLWHYGDGANPGRLSILDVTNGVVISGIDSTSIGISAAAWTEFTATFVTPPTCVSMRLYLRSGAANGSISYYDDISVQALTVADQFAKITAYNVSGSAECAMTIGSWNQAGMVLRYQDDNDYLLCYIDRLDGTCHFVKNVAGTVTNIFAAAAVTYAAGKRLWVEINDVTGTVYYGGISVGSGTVPASTYKVWGLFSSDANNSFTSFLFRHMSLGSISTRHAQSRAGGRVRDFYDDYSVGVVGMQGFGMPPLKYNTIGQAILPGEQMQSVKTESRQFTLVMEPAGGSLSTLHTRRDSLIEALKPDLVSPMQPVRLRYTGATNEVEIAAYYAGGLEGNIDGAQGVQERFAVRFLATEPCFYAIKESAAIFTTKQTLTNCDYVVKKVDSTWSRLVGASQLNATVHDIALHANGFLYLGGAFTNVGDANGDYIVAYDILANTWSSLGTGTNNTVRTITLTADMRIYAGGEFTSAGGVANTAKIAYWDGQAWAAMGTGAADNIVYALCVGHDGSVYAAGTFTLMGGVANTVRIARWDGSAWNALGTGMDAAVTALATAPNGDIYAGGNFTTAGGVAAQAIARWNGTTWAAVGSSTALNAAVNVLAFGPDGTLYVGGAFTNADGIANADYIAKWNGTTWSALGTGANNQVSSLAFDAAGLLYAGGLFTSMGGLTLADRLAIWNGTMWLQPDIDLPGSASINAILAFDFDLSALYAPFTGGVAGHEPVSRQLFIGYSTAGDAITSEVGSNAITNGGSANAYFQKLWFRRFGGTSATLEWIKNETTGKSLWFNYALQDGESITVILTPGRKTIVSAFLGNIIGRTSLPGSDFGTWTLAPGTNNVSAKIKEAGTPGLVAWMLYRNSYWSPDGAN